MNTMDKAAAVLINRDRKFIGLRACLTPIMVKEHAAADQYRSTSVEVREMAEAAATTPENRAELLTLAGQFANWPKLANFRDWGRCLVLAEAERGFDGSAVSCWLGWGRAVGEGSHGRGETPANVGGGIDLGLGVSVG